MFNKKKEMIKNKQTYQLLQEFYNSFFTDTYNELNIQRYRPIRDAIGLVMRKFEKDDHPLAYTSKLVMYIQSRLALNHLHLSQNQQKIMHRLGQNCKYIDLNFVYSSPLNDWRQFI